MRRGLIATVAAAAGALAVVLPVVLPASAPATIAELQFKDSSAPQCPLTPCTVVARETGFQVSTVGQRDAMVAPAAGRIVAFSVSLGAPVTKDVQYFDAHEGGTAQAGVAVLRPAKGASAPLVYKLVAESPPFQLQPYFGSTAQFPLTTTLAVQKGDVIALSVPTWAPSLAISGVSSSARWRASLPKVGCKDFTSCCVKNGTQAAQATIGGTVQYYCLYNSARIAYTATFISDPTLASKLPKTTPTTTGTTTTDTGTTTTGTGTTTTGTTGTSPSVTVIG